MFTCQIQTPFHIVFKFHFLCFHFLLEQFYTFSVTHFLEFGFRKSVQVFQLSFFYSLIEEFNVLLVIGETILDTELDVIFSQLHTVMNISKSDFRFNHPEFSQMFLSVRYFSSESRSKGIHIAHSTTIVFNSQLTTDSQISRFTEELLFIVDLSLFFILRDLVDVFVKDSRDLEHITCSFCIWGSYDRGMDIDEATGLIEEMGSHDTTIPDSSYRWDEIGSRTKMSNVS